MFWDDFYECEIICFEVSVEIVMGNGDKLDYLCVFDVCDVMVNLGDDIV